MKLFGITLGALAATVATAIPALAQTGGLLGGTLGLVDGLINNLPIINQQTPASAVPEIDASSGLLAVAAVLAALAFAWERKRRA